MKASVKGQSAIGSAVSELTKSLSNKARNTGKAAAQAQKLGVIVSEIGEQIGMRDIDVTIGKGETIRVVESMLREAIAAGLTCDKHDVTGDMLKAPNKTFAGELWTIFVDAINAPRIAYFEQEWGKDYADFTAEEKAEAEVAKGTRDNYLTRIRAFVRDRGVQPLDLYGNRAQAVRLAALKKSGGKKTNATSEDSGSDESSTDSVQVQAHERAVSGSTYQGVSAVSFHLQQILQANPKAKASGAFLTLIAAIEDCANEAADIIEQENKAKQGKGKAK